MRMKSPNEKSQIIEIKFEKSDLDDNSELFDYSPCVDLNSSQRRDTMETLRANYQLATIAAIYNKTKLKNYKLVMRTPADWLENRRW